MIPTETLPLQHKPRPSQERSWIGTVLGILVLGLLLAASIWLIQKADATKPKNWNQDQLTYLPSGKILKPMAMDLDEALAAVFWVNGMIYFADAYLEKKSYRWMNHILDIVTLLNPRFKPAYEFGGVVLTKQKSEIPKTLLLLNRGIEEFPEDWRLRLYATLAQLNLDSNYAKAAEYLKPIVLANDIPSHIRTLGASLLNKGGGQRVALAFLVDSYLKTENTIHREIFVEKILKLYPRQAPQLNGLDTLAIKVKQKEVVEKVLKELSLEPGIALMGLGVIHEFLSGTVSPQTQKLMDLLYK